MCSTLSCAQGIHNYAPRHLDQAVQFLDKTIQKYPYEDVMGPAYDLSDLPHAMEVAMGKQFSRVLIKPNLWWTWRKYVTVNNSTWSCCSSELSLEGRPYLLVFIAVFIAQTGLSRCSLFFLRRLIVDTIFIQLNDYCMFACFCYHVFYARDEEKTLPTEQESLCRAVWRSQTSRISTVSSRRRQANEYGTVVEFWRPWANWLPQCGLFVCLANTLSRSFLLDLHSSRLNHLHRRSVAPSDTRQTAAGI